jgi:hypothetical protein
MQFIPGKGKSNDDVQSSTSQGNSFVETAQQFVGSSCPPNHQSLASPPKDQGSCGSCWTFATAAAYESAWNRINDEVLDLAEEYTLECLNAYNVSKTPQSSCIGGIMDYALDMIVSTGLPLESTYPYAASSYGSVAGFPSTISDCSNTANFNKIVFPSNQSDALWYRYDNLTSSSIQTLLQNGSLVVAYYVDTPFYSYSSGVYSCSVNAT